MFKILSNFKKYISKENINNYYKIIFLSLSAALSELISIGSIIPFTTALFNISVFRTKISDFFGIELNDISDTELISLTIVTFIIFLIMVTSVRILLQRNVTKLAYEIGFDISKSLFDKLIFQSYDQYIKSNSNVIISNITNKINTIIGNVAMPFIVLSSSLIIIVSIVSLLLYISFEVAIFAFFYFSMAYLLIGFFMKKKLNKNSTIMSLASDNIIKILQESVGNFRDIYLFNLHDSVISNFRENEKNYRTTQASNAFLSSFPRFLIESMSVVFLLIMAVYLYFSQSQDIVKAIPLIAGFAFGAQKLVPIFQQVFVAWSNYNGSKKLFIDVLEYLNKKSNEEVYDESKNNFNFSKSIKLIDVSFGYDNHTLFDNISLEIKKGDRICLKGESGVGKSTLTDIIIGFLQPQSGKVMFDDIDSKNISPNYIKSLISNVPQNIFISNKSILENIAPGLKIDDIDLNKINKIVKQVSIDEWINSLESGLNTILYENGKNLSGGQKQRIGIARSLYKDPEIIIFDEATSSLDSETEIKIIETINNISTDITIIFITHDENFSANYNKSFKLIDRKLKNIY